MAPSAPHPTADAQAANTVWAALAPLWLLRSRGRHRVSADGGKSYRARDERPLTNTRPSAPAALVIHDRRGLCRLLVVDLDVGRAGQPQVDTDFYTALALLTRCGLAAVTDRSPTGGRHLYVPLSKPLPWTEARDLVAAFGHRLPSLDPSVMTRLNDSCIRIPGSTHRHGGFQTLDGPVDAAAALLRSGNPPAGVARLTAALSAELASVTERRRAEATLAAGTDGNEDPDADAVQNGLSPRMYAIAYAGDTAGYLSGSEARFAVVKRCAAVGVTWQQLAAAMATGTLPGLAGFYARYRDPHKALLADWTKALHEIGTETAASRERVRKPHTSDPPTHPPGIKEGIQDQQRVATNRSPGDPGFLSDWRAQQHVSEQNRWTGRDAHGKRMVWRALGVMALQNGSRYIDVGTRGLAIAAGMDHGTLAGHLRDMRAEDDPVIDLVERDRGLRGDLYELRLPAAVQDRSSLPWRRRQLHACRAAFRVLGQLAAFVYEALEQPHEGLTIADLSLATGASRSAVYAALSALAGWDLAVQTGGRWQLGATPVDHVGRLLGADALQAAQIARYRRQRTAWWAHCGIVIETPTSRDPDDSSSWPWPLAPPDAADDEPRDDMFEDARDLVRTVLGVDPT